MSCTSNFLINVIVVGFYWCIRFRSVYVKSQLQLFKFSLIFFLVAFLNLIFCITPIILRSSALIFHWALFSRHQPLSSLNLKLTFSFQCLKLNLIKRVSQKIWEITNPRYRPYSQGYSLFRHGSQFFRVKFFHARCVDVSVQNENMFKARKHPTQPPRLPLSVWAKRQSQDWLFLDLLVISETCSDLKMTLKG